MSRTGWLPCRPAVSFPNTPIEILIAPWGRLDEYDYVPVDCPPNLGIITLNGLRLADGYIIPDHP